MAYYWDYESASTSTSTTNDYWGRWSTASSGSNYTTTNIYTDGGTTGYYYRWVEYTTVIRRFLIEVPAHWDEAVVASFTRLINDETQTGFKIEMVINGEIKIADPSIEKRSMPDFRPLLRSRANSRDRQKIDDFFATFGDAPANPAA